MSKGSEKDGGGFSLWRILGAALLIHVFFGWEWLGNLASGQSSETRRAALVATLDGYAKAKPRTIDPVALGAQVPDLTDVQLSALEDSLKGVLVTAKGPVYDVSSTSSHLGLTRYEVTVWALTISPPRLMLRATCIARNKQEAAMIEGLGVGRSVTITGKVSSIGRTLGMKISDCIVQNG